MSSSKTRVMFVLEYFPQISQTYIKNEIEAVRDQYDIKIIAQKKPDLPYTNHHPYTMLTELGQIREAIEEFKPHVLHTHYLENADVICPLAQQTGVPFTIRAHSFDCLKGMHAGKAPSVLKNNLKTLNSDLCLGVLTFPFTRASLEKFGLRADKLRDCFPVINYAKFHDRGPNADGVMNVGACLPKKRMEDFVVLGARFPGKKFDLYPLGYIVDTLNKFNADHGSPVTIHEPVQPDDMPVIYKQHNWLVYTACPKLNKVGWPLAVAEAQAAGLGICVPNLRPDLAQYVGGAGFLYNSVEEAAKILSQPYPNEMRELGFQQAKRSCIRNHKHLLTELWDRAASSPRPVAVQPVARPHFLGSLLRGWSKSSTATK